MDLLQSVVAVLFSLLVCGQARPFGAPMQACSTLTPVHGSFTSQILPGGYFLYSSLLNNGGVYTAGTAYNVILQGPEAFEGFIIQTRDAASNDLLGSFNITDPANTKQLTCASNAAATVTHTGRSMKARLSVNWTAPSFPASGGTVWLYYSVVKRYDTFYANINSAMYRPTTVTPPPPPTISTPPTSSPSSTPATMPILCPRVFMNESAGQLNFTSPPGCSRQSCDVYVAMAPNPMNSSFLNIYMEGAAAGWVAVGFSVAGRMDNTDVIGCKVEADGNVSVVDTWNPTPRYSANQIDDDGQIGVCTRFATYTNGRIRCFLSRYGPAVDPNKDLDWNAEYYVTYARRTSSNMGSPILRKHSETPSVTDNAINPFSVTGNVQTSAYPDKILLQVHGILMLFAWPVLATVAIFFASWMKPALPNGEWFQTHRALLIISLFTTAAGFIFAFVALARNPTRGLINFSNSRQIAHFAIGIIVMLLQIVNPIIAIFRCKPGSPHRWIFDLTHGSIVGLLAVVLAYANVGIGLGLFGEKYTLRTSFVSLATYIGYICVIVILQVVLHVLFLILAIKAPLHERAALMPTLFQWCFCEMSKSGDKTDVVELKKQDKEEEKEEDEEEEKKEEEVEEKNEEEKEKKKTRKPASKDAPLRWISTVAQLIATLIVLAVIVMVAMG